MDGAAAPAKLTYNNILSGFESADVVVIVEIIHLSQDGCHAGYKTTLEWKRKIKALGQLPFCIKAPFSTVLKHMPHFNHMNSLDFKGTKHALS